ncbi:MAG: dihydropteroate synthase, partial [Thalassobaculaceae bacterium]
GDLSFQSLLVGWRQAGGAGYCRRPVDRATRATLARWADEIGWAEGWAGQLAALTEPRGGAPAPGAGPRVMGVINVTPDSFSDGGRFLDPALAIAEGRAMAAAGAAILDIGGESTRPGAAPVPVDEEERRVTPVIAGLVGVGPALSIDTRRAAVMAAAVAAGADLINDVSALTGDDDSLAVAAGSGRPVILMHMRGTPADMQEDPRYDFAPFDIFDWLQARLAAAAAAGIPAARVITDPGFGFGKTVAHNLQILSWLGLFQALGCPVVAGLSRKSSIAKIASPHAPEELPAARRLPGSLAFALAAATRGADILRVHDVAETVQALAIWRATERGMPPA